MLGIGLQEKSSGLNCVPSFWAASHPPRDGAGRGLGHEDGARGRGLVLPQTARASPQEGTARGACDLERGPPLAMPAPRPGPPGTGTLSKQLLVFLSRPVCGIVLSQPEHSEMISIFSHCKHIETNTTERTPSCDPTTRITFTIFRTYDPFFL